MQYQIPVERLFIAEYENVKSWTGNQKRKNNKNNANDLFLILKTGKDIKMSSSIQSFLSSLEGQREDIDISGLEKEAADTILLTNIRKYISHDTVVYFLSMPERYARLKDGLDDICAQVMSKKDYNVSRFRGNKKRLQKTEYDSIAGDITTGIHQFEGQKEQDERSDHNIGTYEDQNRLELNSENVSSVKPSQKNSEYADYAINADNKKKPVEDMINKDAATDDDGLDLSADIDDDINDYFSPDDISDQIDTSGFVIQDNEKPPEDIEPDIPIISKEYEDKSDKQKTEQTEKKSELNSKNKTDDSGFFSNIEQFQNISEQFKNVSLSEGLKEGKNEPSKTQLQNKINLSPGQLHARSRVNDRQPDRNMPKNNDHNSGRNDKNTGKPGGKVKNPVRTKNEEPALQRDISVIEKDIFGREFDSASLSFNITEVQSSKARLYMSLHTRMVENIKKLIPAIAALDPPDNVYFQMINVLKKSYDYEDFKQSWRLANPRYSVDLPEDIYTTLLKEADYIEELNEKMFIDDEWE
mgnify:CR=1 FL=1